MTAKFTLDGGGATYDAVAYGPRWNGWLTPTVTRETYERIVATEDPDGRWLALRFDTDGVATLATLGDADYDDVTIAPDADGNYDLADLGWTFFDADDYEGDQ